MESNENDNKISSETKTETAREIRLRKNREYMRRKRANETQEQRNARLIKSRDYMRQKRDNELYQRWLEEKMSRLNISSKKTE